MYKILSYTKSIIYDMLLYDIGVNEPTLFILAKHSEGSYECYCFKDDRDDVVHTDPDVDSGLPVFQKRLGLDGYFSPDVVGGGEIDAATDGGDKEDSEENQRGNDQRAATGFISEGDEEEEASDDLDSWQSSAEDTGETGADGRSVLDTQDGCTINNEQESQNKDEAPGGETGVQFNV